MRRILIILLIFLSSFLYGTDIYDIEMNTSFESLLKAKKPILIDFGGKMCVDCVPCHDLFEKKNKQYNKQAIIKYVDIQKNREFAKRMNVDIVPMQIFWTEKGKPYIPSKNVKIKFNFLRDKKGVIYRTLHEGILTEEEFEVIIKDMGIK